MPLEVACFNPESALIAAQVGADRIELCANQQLGGTTPSPAEFLEVKKLASSVPVNVMIRPRGGDFEYSEEEFTQMTEEVKMFLDMGADGFVFGILKCGRVDVQRCLQLVQLAHGKMCTFHRAFDELEDIEVELEAVSTCGFSAILTSGGKHDAIMGIDRLSSLVALCKLKDTNLEIIIGGGVRASNVEVLMEETGAQWFHTSASLGNETVASAEELRSIRAKGVK